METVITLPGISLEAQAPIDPLRALVRRSPELSRLGRRIGCTRCYTREEAGAIIAAWKARQQKRARPAAAV